MVETQASPYIQVCLTTQNAGGNAHISDLSGELLAASGGEELVKAITVYSKALH